RISLEMEFCVGASFKSKLFFNAVCLASLQGEKRAKKGDYLVKRIDLKEIKRSKIFRTRRNFA
ncbi:MAG: hypothetical protein AAF443_08130, partial [Chlamydiota bacterium]